MIIKIRKKCLTVIKKSFVISLSMPKNLLPQEEIKLKYAG